MSSFKVGDRVSYREPLILQDCFKGQLGTVVELKGQDILIEFDEVIVSGSGTTKTHNGRRGELKSARLYGNNTAYWVNFRGGLTIEASSKPKKKSLALTKDKDLKHLSKILEKL